MISNLQKIKWGEEKSKQKKEEGSVTVNREQWEDEETKRKGKGWKKCKCRCELIGRRRFFFFFFGEQGEEKFNWRKENIKNKWMMQLLMWLNRRVTTINTTFQLLHIQIWLHICLNPNAPTMNKKITLVIVMCIKYERTRVIFLLIVRT